MKSSKVILISQIVILSVILIGCSEDDDGVFNSGKQVTYSVSGSPGGFSITYEINGNTEQQTIDGTSWNESFTGSSGDFVYVSAQADNENASVTAEIEIDGDNLKSASSHGDYVIATASGTIP